MAEFRPLGPNPFVVGSPIRDAKLFFGRDDDLEFLKRQLVADAGAGGALVVLCGARRAGKTSLLLQAAGGRLGEEAFPIYIDLQQLAEARSAADLWSAIAARALARLKEEKLPPGEAEQEAPTEREKTPNEKFRRFVQALAKALGKRRAVFLLDEYEVLERRVHAGAFGAETIDGLSAILDAGIPVSFVLAGAYRLSQRDPELWGRLVTKAVHRRISFLTPRDAEKLLREPLAGKVEFDDGVIAAAIRLSAGQPFLVQALGRAIVERLEDQSRNRCTAEDLEAAMEAAVEEALPHFAFWWRSLGFLGRMVASVVASALEEPEAWVPPEAAEQMLAQDRDSFGFEVGKAAFRGALEALVESEDLERSAEGAYRFRADLVRRWIGSAHPVWDVVRCAAEEEETEPLAARGVTRRRRLRRGHLIWAGIVALAVVLVVVRLFFPQEAEEGEPAGPGAPAFQGDFLDAEGWRLGPDLVPQPAGPADLPTLRAGGGRVTTFRSRGGGETLEVTLVWPPGVPAPLHGWLDGLRNPEESWLWGVVPGLAPDPLWLEALDAKYAEEPPPGTMPGWIAALLDPTAKATVTFERGVPARVAFADRTGWAQSEWCFEPGAWVRCDDGAEGAAVRRIEFTLLPQGRQREPRLSVVRFLDGEGRPAADLLGRTELAFFYRDIDPDPQVEQWEVESVAVTLNKLREDRGAGADAVATTGNRVFFFYYRRDRDLAHRGGELVAVRIHNHVGRRSAMGDAWGPEVHAVGFVRARGGEVAYFFDADQGPVRDATGATGYREEVNGDGVRTALVALGPDGECASYVRREDEVPVKYCRAMLTGVPAVPAPDSERAAPRLAEPYAIAYRDAAGKPVDGPEGVAAFSLRDLGPAPAPCERLLGVQHHDQANALTAPPAGPFRGAAATRLGVHFRDGRLSDLVRTDCFDGPCKVRDVADETWSCNAHGCTLSNVPFSCR